MPARGREMGELQLAVMNVLWTKKRATVSEVLETFSEPRKPAYTTVLTVLRNLEKRGMVKHDQLEGTRKHRYRAIVSAHDTRGDILLDVLNRLFAGSPALLIKHLLTTEGFGLDELREIRQVLDTQERAITGESAS